MVKIRRSRKVKSVKYGTETIYLAPKMWYIFPEAVNKSTSENRLN